MNRDEINTALGMSIRRVRKAKHITQDELSKRVGITRSVLTRYELGQIEMSMTMYVSICDALPCDRFTNIVGSSDVGVHHPA